VTEARLTLEEVAKAMNHLGTVEAARANRFRVVPAPGRGREAIVRAKERLRCDHMVQMAAVDNGKSFELHYHLTGPHRTVVSIIVEVPRDNPRIPSVHDLLPPTGIYERQIHDLFGIEFEGHPGLKRIILTEDWPEGEYPLRKDWKMGPNRFYGGISKEGT